MKYKNKTSYKAIQWTGKNEKEIVKFLGERFVLKNDFIDSFPRKDMSIYTKETDDFVDNLCFTNSYIIMPEGENAKPKVIIEENFKEEFVEIKKKIKNEKNKTPKKI